MSKKAGRAPWFKWHHAWRDVLLALDKEDLADVVIMAIDYFSNNENIPIEKLGIEDKTMRFVFRMIKQSIDDAYKEYEDRVEDGRRGAEIRKSKEGKGG